jgi:hypothetical protein
MKSKTKRFVAKAVSTVCVELVQLLGDISKVETKNPFDCLVLL